MTRLNRLAPLSTMAGRTRERRPAHGDVREARTRRSFDAVLASYIRDISARTTPALPQAAAASSCATSGPPSGPRWPGSTTAG